MLKKRKKTSNSLLVTAMIVLVMVVVSACQNEYYYVVTNFKIEKVYLTPITIDGFPADEAKLYLMEVAFSDCPPDSFLVDGTLKGIRIYSHGSIDTVTRVKFTHDGLIVHPKQLHWDENEKQHISQRDFSEIESTESPLCNNIDTLDAWMYIQEEGIDKVRPVFYSTDYELLCGHLMSISDDDMVPCRYDSSYYCSSTFLVAFDSNSSLPNDGYVKFRKRKVKIEIKDKPLKFKLKGTIQHYIPSTDFYENRYK
ncbi:MAG: hypothetical protein IKQ47_02255 [Prevotella sp.]|nr:hypothetical protein [Prevotella sp.]